MDNENLYDLVEQNNVKIEIPETLIKADEKTKTLSSDEYSYKLSLRRDQIEDEKELKKFIKSCEIMIRRSTEYRDWTRYIREVLGFTKCSLTDEINGQVTCAIHHHPISLYTIVKLIILKYLAKEKEFCSFDIATKVIEIHYQNHIGYINLIASLHEKFHNGFLQIPINLVQGDYQCFLTNYRKYLEEKDQEIIKSRLEINYENCGFGNKYLWKTNQYMIDKET